MHVRILGVFVCVYAGAASAVEPIDVNARFAKLALDCAHREYPNKLAHVLNGPGDAKTPSKLTPAFLGCYDWHSAVHAHWLLARLARLNPQAAYAAPARAALAKSLTPKKVATEVAYLSAPGRVSFERPYGLAWLLQLAMELREWQSPEAVAWVNALAPLEQAASSRLKAWLPKLSFPVRVGEHDQTAFALGLVLDWARVAGDVEMVSLVEQRLVTWYENDVACPVRYEPGGQDFLSACLGEADVMRRVKPPEAFAAWLSRFLPGIEAGGAAWLTPAMVTDPADPKLAHLDGLNLSRAWMLEGISAALPAADARRRILDGAAATHRAAGLAAVTGAHYEGGHWLGSFATYLVTARGAARP